MSEQEIDLDEIREKLLEGERLRFDLWETGALQAKVAKRRIKNEKGVLEAIRLAQKDENTIRFNVRVKAMSYPFTFYTRYDIGNDEEEGQIRASNLRVKGPFLGRGHARRVAREILGQPNRNLELETDLPENSLCVRIVEGGTEVWLNNENLT